MWLTLKYSHTIHDLLIASTDVRSTRTVDHLLPSSIKALQATERGRQSADTAKRTCIPIKEGTVPEGLHGSDSDFLPIMNIHPGGENHESLFHAHASACQDRNRILTILTRRAMPHGQTTGQNRNADPSFAVFRIDRIDYLILKRMAFEDRDAMSLRSATTIFFFPEQQPFSLSTPSLLKSGENR